MKSDKNTIDDIFERGVGEFIDPDNSFREKLEAKIAGDYTKDIIIKFGIDPTRPDIHVGHAVVFRKLRQLQDLGCKVIFLVGDFTAHIGDPTGKSKVRPQLEQKQIEKNMQTYLDQVGKILKTEEEVFSWIRNSEWFYGVSDLISEDATVKFLDTDIPANSFMGKALLYNQTRMQVTHLKKEITHGVTLVNLFWILGRITHARLIERDMFQDRLKKGEELYMHEMLYPVIQGVDSHLIANIYGSCDLEIGGTDQTFNMLMGRDVMKINKQPQQSVLSMKLLEGTDGKEKMSKSLDNYIAITDDPSDMYGKVMSVPDTSLLNYFELSTYTPMGDIKKIEDELASKKVNPRDIKMELARQIVATYHSQASAEEAESDFVKTFQKGGLPEHIKEVKGHRDDFLLDIFLREGVVTSKNEFKRLIQEGAIRTGNGDKVDDELTIVGEGGIFKIGKKRFLGITAT